MYYVTRGEVYLTMEKPNEAIVDLDHALSIKDDIKEAYENRATCYKKLAEIEKDPTKKAELVSLGEADEIKVESLKNSN